MVDRLNWSHTSMTIPLNVLNKKNGFRQFLQRVSNLSRTIDQTILRPAGPISPRDLILTGPQKIVFILEHKTDILMLMRKIKP